MSAGAQHQRASRVQKGADLAQDVQRLEQRACARRAAWHSAPVLPQPEATRASTAPLTKAHAQEERAQEGLQVGSRVRFTGLQRLHHRHRWVSANSQERAGANQRMSAGQTATRGKAGPHQCLAVSIPAGLLLAGPNEGAEPLRCGQMPQLAQWGSSAGGPSAHRQRACKEQRPHAR